MGSTRSKTWAATYGEDRVRTGSVASQDRLGTLGQTARVDWAALLDMDESEPEKPKAGRPCVVDDKTRARICAAHRAGVPTTTLAREFGVNERTVKSWCMAYEPEPEKPKKVKVAPHVGMVGKTPTCLNCQMEMTWVHEHDFARLECPACRCRTALHRTDAECLADVRVGMTA